MQQISVHFSTGESAVFEKVREVLLDARISFRWTALDMDTGILAYGQGEIKPTAITHTMKGAL